MCPICPTTAAVPAAGTGATSGRAARMPGKRLRTRRTRAPKSTLQSGEA